MSLIILLLFFSFYIKLNKDFNFKINFITFNFININSSFLLLNYKKSLLFLILINKLILLSFIFKGFISFIKRLLN
jgi:hypothetical protein